MLILVLQVFKSSDAAYSGKTLQMARSLFAFASAHRGPFGTSVPEMGAVYPSDAILDDLSWAAGWLYHRTHENAYLREARTLLDASRSEEPERWQPSKCFERLSAPWILGYEARHSYLLHNSCKNLFNCLAS